MALLHIIAIFFHNCQAAICLDTAKHLAEMLQLHTLTYYINETLEISNEIHLNAEKFQHLAIKIKLSKNYSINSTLIFWSL